MGPSYAVGTQIQPGLGTILYNGGALVYNHTGLTPGTTYYYKIWSKNTGKIHSSGLISNATATAVLNPQTFTATAMGQSTIDLSWLKNIHNNDVIIAWNTTNTFTTPTNGITYITGNQILPGQGTILYQGSLTAFSHTNLTPSTTYYYKIWSVATGHYYSSGTIGNAATTAVQNPSTFTATAAGPNQVNLAWVLNASANEVMIAWNTTNTFSTPANGTNYNSGQQITVGGGTVLFVGNSPLNFAHTGRTPGVTYYYRIWSKAGELIIQQELPLMPPPST